MKDTERILGLIPARGESKRIPRKNLALLGGKPLIAYTIATAREAVAQGILSRVIVSTEDSEIAAVARGLGADVPFMRPKELAGDYITDLEVCKHVVKEFSREGWNPTTIIMLRPTQPLRTVEDIKAALMEFRNGKYDSVRSLTLVEHHPYWMKVIKDGFVVPFIETGKPDEQLRSQDLPAVYRLNGMVDVVAVRNFMQDSMYGKKTGAVVIEQQRALDLDTPFDLFLAECTLKFLEKKKNVDR